MPRLTTHVLDTMNGIPAAGVRVRLYRSGETAHSLCECHTDQAGRATCSLADDAELQQGSYDLVFSLGPYFAAAGAATTTPAFLDDVVIRFGIGGTAAHYHIPLLASPWSYTTYRGQ